jgi:rhodanese-related sulfurtransferase
MAQQMNSLNRLSIILLSLSLILAVLPLSSHRSFNAVPATLSKTLEADQYLLTVDQIAAMIAAKDSALQLIDLRSHEEYMALCIPGSVNIPYETMLDSDPDSFLNDPVRHYVFYSNGDLKSNYALVIARGLGYRNVFSMQGGLNEWFRLVMNTGFTGSRISARENALFSSRAKAGQLFTGYNSLPDSLKQKFLDSGRTKARKLDGGCE